MRPHAETAEALNRQHSALDERLSLLAGDPDLAPDQRALAESWRALIGEARSSYHAALRVAFVAQVGRGKSTLLSAATGLHLQIQGSPKDWSVLPVGDGRTTLGEIHVRPEDRLDVLLEVEPIPEAVLDSEVRLFAEDLWDAAHERRGRPFQIAGEELYELFRAWLEPHAVDRRKELIEAAKGYQTSADLYEALARRLDIPTRCQKLSRSFAANESGLSELRDVLHALMDGELAGGPAPRTSQIRVPRVFAPVDVEALIDTQGLDTGLGDWMLKARPDLQQLLADANTLFVVCSEYEGAPDAVATELVKNLLPNLEEGRRSARVFRLVIVDRRDAARGPKAERQRVERIAQCEDVLRRGEPSVTLPSGHVVALDARREGPVLARLLQEMSAQARDQRAARWEKALDEAETALASFKEVELAARLRELDLRLWWEWDAGLATKSNIQIHPLAMLGAGVQAPKYWVQHWSHLRAAVRRRGRYERLDLVELAAQSVASLAVTSYLAAMNRVLRFAQEYVGSNDNTPEAAHIVLRLQQFDFAWYVTDLTKAWRQELSRYFQSTEADSLWSDCEDRWGQGPGYVADIGRRFLDEAQRANVRLAPGIAPAAVETRLPPRPPLFRVREISVDNFRGVASGALALPSLSVLVGDNGTGKTAWLEAVAAAIGALLPGMGAGEAPSLTDADVRQVIRELGGVPDRQHQYPLTVTASGELHGRSIQWSRRVDRPSPETEASEDDALRRLTQDIVDDLQAHKTRELPVLCYYGTQRLWPADLEADTDRRDVGGRLDGYRDCLMAASTHRHMLDWVRKFTFVELQQKRPVSQLKAVERAVVGCVEGARAFAYDVATEELCLTMDDGSIVPFRMLSDGYRNIVAMVADIAWRASVLNPQLGVRAPELAEGVVLIDEIDLHLHPRWQRRVLDDMRRAFPRLQIITTTHSPFIIQSLPPGSLINLDPGASSAPYSNRSPEDITEAVMGVDVPQRSHRYQQMIETAARYYELLDQVPRADDNELSMLRRRLDELEEPFSLDVAFTAFLRHERLAAERGIR